jgi:hypothetical protein
MDSVEVQGFIDGQHHLTASVPGFIPPGPVTIVIMASSPALEEADEVWIAGIAREWAEDLGDERQDIYTLSDGEAIDPA